MRSGFFIAHTHTRESLILAVESGFVSRQTRNTTPSSKPCGGLGFCLGRVGVECLEEQSVCLLFLPDP